MKSATERESSVGLDGQPSVVTSEAFLREARRLCLIWPADRPKLMTYKCRFTFLTSLGSLRNKKRPLRLVPQYTFCPGLTRSQSECVLGTHQAFCLMVFVYPTNLVVLRCEMSSRTALS